jgi:hypothetical protein
MHLPPACGEGILNLRQSSSRTRAACRTQQCNVQNATCNMQNTTMQHKPQKHRAVRLLSLRAPAASIRRCNSAGRAIYSATGSAQSMLQISPPLPSPAPPGPPPLTRRDPESPRWQGKQRGDDGSAGGARSVKGWRASGAAGMASARRGQGGASEAVGRGDGSRRGRAGGTASKWPSMTARTDA